MTEWNEILTPEYDSTWPFNFKWAWNHETDETDVWKVQGGTDGRPAHRAETEKRWGRPSNVGAGDVLGVAAYIPSERKLDGTVVAPGEVQLQAYYEKPIPDGVRLWFAQAYPEATIRAATIVHPRLGRKTTEFAEKKRTGMLKWVWNKRDGTLIWEPNDDNLPTHTDKTTAEWGRSLQLGSGGFDSHASPDFIGYAYPEPGKVEIDAYSSCPPAAIAAVKTQLAEWFPHDQIVSTADDVEQHEFSGDPGQYRAASLIWVEEHLGKVSEDHGNRLQISLEPSNTKSGLLGRFLPRWVTRRVAGADMDGAMVALFLSEAQAKKLRPRGGEPIENMHITLLYFNEKASERSDWDEVKKIVEQVANQTPALSGKVSGYGVFNTPDGDVLWASPSIQGLAELRHKLFEACEDAGYHVNTEHDWVPHITLKYKHRGKLPDNKEIVLEFKELSFAQGEDHHDFEFTGNFEKKAVGSNDYLDWSGWEGAHRFVTDGKEILTDPETEPIKEEQWKSPELEGKFREIYPDAKSFASGWTIPTADGMGLGIYAPAAGHGDKHEPGLHEIIQIVEKELGKPAHLITNHGHISDEKMYAPGEVSEWQTL